MTKITWIVLFCGIVLVFFSALLKIYTIQTKNQTPLRYGGEKEDRYKERGAIFDRNGNILAMQIKSWTVGLRLTDTWESQNPIEKLANILDLSYEKLTLLLEKNPKKYVQIKRFVSKEQHDVIRELQRRGELVGVQMHEIKWRKYPGRDSMAHVIGYYGMHGKGLDGIERTFDSYLQAEANGGMGHSIYLTIDSVLQKSIEEIVKETLEESKASHITTVLMDAKTGEILSFVNVPSFDLNKYYTYDPIALSNKIIQYNYEPGSVFKIFTIASVLDAGLIRSSSTFDARGPYKNKRYGFVINDIWYPGIISTSQILKYSSNVGTVQAIQTMGEEHYFQYLKKFGFGEKTRVPLSGESTGILNIPKRWSGRSKQTIGLGQEIAVTAMQMTSAATAFANDGMVLAPLLVQKIVTPRGKIIYKGKRSPKNRVIRPHIAREVLRMMKTATEPGGTAHRMRVGKISISAKTGTAQVYDQAKGEYSREKFIASTLGIIPTEEPQLIIYAAIHNPTSGEIYGGRTTAPMIKKMLGFILPYMGMTAGEIYTIRAKKKVERADVHIATVSSGEQYGNYIGMSKREVWALFAHKSITLSLVGNGHVARQTPPPGTPIRSGRVLQLYLR